MARFFLEARDQEIEPVELRHQEQLEAERLVAAAIPLRWRRALIQRAQLDRFLFAAEDIVVAVGQDGLVANVAKYLADQPVVGINPGRWDGVLVRHAPKHTADLLQLAERRRAKVESRTLVEAKTSDGQRLRALNEIFIGHERHQSARYLLSVAGQRERHSSSGLIITTGTGATGWARSIHRQRRDAVALPEPTEERLAFFVREAWPSSTTGTEVTQGAVDAGARVFVRSEMNQGGVAFGDGIEDDRIELPFGQEIEVAISARRLQLVVG
jgi:hypothetical protein